MPADLDLTFNIERSDGDAVVSVHDESDLETDDAVVQVLSSAALVKGIDMIEVSATEVSFVHSSGEHGLLLGQRSALDNGPSSTVRYSRPAPVARILAIAGLENVLPARIG